MIHFAGLLFVVGIILASSDWGCFPVPNFVGTGILIVCLLLTRYLERRENGKTL